MNKITIKKFILPIVVLALILVFIFAILLESNNDIYACDTYCHSQKKSDNYTSFEYTVYNLSVTLKESFSQMKPLTAIELDIVELVQTNSENIDIIEGSGEVLYVWVSLGYYTLLAYCPCVICCGIWSAEHPSRIGTDFVQLTASGTIPTAGRTIAVNPLIIPYGTQVKIDGHVYIAEDTGTVPRRSRVIDIFHDCHDEAIQFGRQRAEVFVKSVINNLNGELYEKTILD